MIILDLVRKRSEMKYSLRVKRTVLIFFICCALKSFIEKARSMIVICLSDEGLEGMMIFNWFGSRNYQTEVNHLWVAS